LCGEIIEGEMGEGCVRGCVQLEWGEPIAPWRR
jgi:hypothetical protein